jgi:hypothetical protein
MLMTTKTETFFEPGDWEGVERCTFTANALVGRGYVPRKGDKIKIDTPVIEFEGEVRVVETSFKVADLYRATLDGGIDVITVKDHGEQTFGPVDVKVIVGGVERQGVFQDIHVREA